jgi:hypothetical protein
MTYRSVAGGLEADFCVKNYILQWGMEDMQVCVHDVTLSARLYAIHARSATTLLAERQRAEREPCTVLRLSIWFS